MRYLSLQMVLLLALAVSINGQNPASTDGYAEQGIAHFEKSDFNGAIADFTKAIELNSTNLEFCFYFRGMAFYRIGKLDEALADVSKAIALREHPRFFDDRGNMLAQKGDLAAALSDLNKAIEISPEYAKAFGDRALVRLMLGEDSAAESDFKKSFELDPRLKPQFDAAVNEIRQRAAIYAEHRKPSDLEILKASWTEAPSSKLALRQSATITMTSTPVSQSGTRVLADPTAKDQGGPPPLLDPSSSSSTTTRDSSPSVQSVDYKFSASLRNTGSRTITSIHWAYVFYPKDGQRPLAYFFSTKINIAPGKEKTLTEQVSAETPKDYLKKPTAYSRERFDDRFIVLRLNYSDGSSWKSSGGVQP